MPANTVYKRSDGRLGYKYTDRLGNRRELVSRKREGVQAFKKRCSDTETSGQDLIKMTFGELYQKWREDYQEANCGPADKATVDFNYKRFIEKKFGHIQITEIERKDINSLLVDLYKQSYARTTLEKVRAVFSRPYNYAIQELALRIYNPADKIRIPKNASKLDLGESEGFDEGLRFIPSADRDRFFAAADSSWYLILFLILLHTGMRPSEALGLKWTDVRGGSIHLKRRISDYGLGHLKTKAAHRAVPLTNTTIDLLWQQHKLLFANGLQKGKFIFPLQDGSQPTMNALRHAFERARTQTKVWKKIGRKYHGELLQDRVDFSMYDFRHTFATMAATKMAPKQLQYIMGHSRIDVTLQIYAGLTNEQREDARAIMDDMAFETATAI